MQAGEELEAQDVEEEVSVEVLACKGHKGL